MDSGLDEALKDPRIKDPRDARHGTVTWSSQRLWPALKSRDLFVSAMTRVANNDEVRQLILSWFQERRAARKCYQAPQPTPF